MLGSLTALSEQTFESDELFSIRDTLQEIIALYTSGDEAASNLKLRELTDSIITASSRSIEELFSEECLRLIFNFVGDGVHELSLHLLSFLTVFSQNFNKLQEFASSSQENFDIFLRSFQHIDNSEILTTYSDFFRDLTFKMEPELGHKLLRYIVTNMFTSDSFSKVQSLGVILRQFLSFHNLGIAEFFFKYLNTYLSEHYSEIVGYGKLSSGDFADRLKHLEATRIFPRNNAEKQSICERLTILDEELMATEQNSRIHIDRASTNVSEKSPRNKHPNANAINRTTRASTPVFITDPGDPAGQMRVCGARDEAPGACSLHDQHDGNASGAPESIDLDAFFITITCLTETLPLAFSLSINVTNNEQVRSGGLIDLTQDFEDRRSSASIDSAFSHGSSRFLLTKYPENAKFDDDPLANRSDSPLTGNHRATSQSKAFNAEDAPDRDDFRLQRSMIPPRHTDLKKYIETGAAADHEGYVGKADSLSNRAQLLPQLSSDSDASASNTPTVQTPFSDGARPLFPGETLPSPTVQILSGIAPDSLHATNDVQRNDDQAFEDLFRAHFMPSTLENEFPPLPILGSKTPGAEAQQAASYYNTVQPLAQNSESDNLSFHILNFPGRMNTNPALLEQMEQFLQIVKIFIYKTSLILSDPCILAFVKLKLLSLLLLLSDIAKDHKYAEFFQVMLESSCYESILHLSIKMEHASVLHSIVYSLVTTAMSTLKTFLLSPTMMTAILHKLKLVYDVNLLHTGQKALQCHCFQDFVDYLAVNGLYPLRNRTSLVSLFLGLVKHWVSTCCGHEFSFTGLFLQSQSMRSSVRDTLSATGASNNLPPGDFGNSRSNTNASTNLDIPRKLPDCSNDTSSLPNFINFTNPNNRCMLVPISSITTEAHILLMKRFLSIFVLSTRTARYFYHMHPVQYYSTPRGNIVSLNASLRAAPLPNPAISTTASLTIKARDPGQDLSFSLSRPLTTSATNVLPHSVILSDYMHRSVNMSAQNHSLLREEDLAGSSPECYVEASLEAQTGRTTSRYTEGDPRSLTQRIVTRYAVELPQSPTKLSHFTDTHIGTSGISLLESTSLLVASATGSITHSSVRDVANSAGPKQSESPQISRDAASEHEDSCGTIGESSDNLVPDLLHQYQDTVSPFAASNL